MLIQKRKNIIIWLLIFSLLFLIIGCAPKESEEEKVLPSEEEKVLPSEEEKVLPDVLVFANFDIGGTTYAQVAALCEGLAERSSIRTRQLAIGTDFGRIVPFRAGDAHVLVADSVILHFLNEGLDVYSTIEWGPQQYRMVWGVTGSSLALITTADSGINTPYDLKGVRYPKIIANASTTLVQEVSLRFADLTFDDVEIVEFAGAADIYTGLLKERLILFVQVSSPRSK